MLLCLLAVPTETATSPSVNLTTHGHITRDEIWRGEIHVIGDIVVNEGVTLTIEPGTRVLIAANSDAENLCTDALDMRQGLNTTDDITGGVHPGEPWRDQGHHVFIVVLGTLLAVGKPDQMIKITSDSLDPGRYDWVGMDMWNGTIAYTIMEYYRVCAPYNQVTVTDSIFRHIGECGIGFDPSEEARVVIERNTIQDAGHELIDTHSPCYAAIRDNHLGPNRSTVNPGGRNGGGNGIIIDGGTPEIIGNTIEGCETGMAFISPPAIPYDTFVAQLCRDNTFTNNTHSFEDHNRNPRGCP